MADMLPASGRQSGDALPRPVEGDQLLHDFQFTGGATLPRLRIHYRTLGHARRDQRGSVVNAVLILHGTGGSGADFMRPEFAGELFGPGQPLDAAEWFIVLPDGIGHGGSARPSDGLRARFPRYGYRDMIAAQYRLLTDGLQVDHLRLIVGYSMGGMHCWLWGAAHPHYMDALLPLACLPTQICARNRVWRRIISDAIRHDPEWRDGEYRRQPPSLRTAAQVLFLMAANPLLRWQQMPTLSDSDAVLDAATAAALEQQDANDVLYQLEASHDYDPAPGLDRIRARLLALNWADDLVNPPELGILERAARRVPLGEACVLPFTDQTRGHQSPLFAAEWKQHLQRLLAHLPAGIV
jgi:homoserine O-acetyltransferase